MIREWVAIAAIFTACAPSTVRVCSEFGCGSGYLDNQTVITAAHNTGDLNLIEYPMTATNGPMIVKGEILYHNRALDIARLITPGPGADGVRYCRASLGNEVLVYTQQAKSVVKIRRAVVMAMNARYIQLNRAAYPGDSGSVVVRSRGRCVVGIVFSSPPGGARVVTVGSQN